MEKKKYRIAGEIHRLDNMITRVLTGKIKAAGLDEVTLIHGWVLHYLYDHREQEIYQRDIEKQFSIGRSAVTNILQLMEKRGLVSRESVAQDARLKRVILTEKGIQSKEIVKDALNCVDEEILAGFSEDERSDFLALLIKLRHNLAPQITDCCAEPEEMSGKANPDQEKSAEKDSEDVSFDNEKQL